MAFTPAHPKLDLNLGIKRPLGTPIRSSIKSQTPEHFLGFTSTLTISIVGLLCFAFGDLKLGEYFC